MRPLGSAASRRRLTSRWRWVAGAAVLAVVVWRTGTGPLLAGVRSLDVRTLGLGAAVAAVTTVATAWRWQVVARALGLRVGLAGAVAACYRSQFLNTVLPGGVVGDVVRGVTHGRDVGDTSRALRAVAWERFFGQAVSAVLALAVVGVLPSPARGLVPVAGGLLLTALVVGAVFAARPQPARTSRIGRAAATLHHDLRAALTVQRAWPGVVVASAVATAGHVTTYVVVARAVGATGPLSSLLPLAVVVLLGAGVPVNLAGWGPREGVAAWAFASAGLGAAQGVAVAVAYGVVVFVASLPGAVALLAASGRLTPRAVREGRVRA